MNKHDLMEDEITGWAKFWATCTRLLTTYPDRPATMSGESEAKKLESRLKMLAEEMLPLLCESEYWLADASVGKGNWAAVPWVAIFDSRESSSAQKGVYPVIHFSPEEPVGIRIGLGVAATEFKSQANEKAAEVHSELSTEERQELESAGFLDVVDGDGVRVEMGTGNLAKKYARGMILERFVPFDELKATPRELTSSLQSLVEIYKAWTDRKQDRSGHSAHASFLNLMRTYAAEKVVFLSPKRDARYYVSDVNDKGCSVERLDSDKAERVTESGYQSRRNWLREQGGAAEREKLDNTVARHMCYLQSADMCLESDRHTARYLPDHQVACEQFISHVIEISSPTRYKPVILSLVIEAVRDGDLTENRITFDWLLPRFIDRLARFEQEVGEQQLAEGFARMASTSGAFWLLAYDDPHHQLSEKPDASQIKRRISHARLHEAFWNAIQQPSLQQHILDAIGQKWWPDMTNIEPNNIWLVPASDSASRINADRTLATKIDKNIPERCGLSSDGNRYAWGTQEHNRSDWQRMLPGDLCLMYTQSHEKPSKGYYYAGRVSATYDSAEVATELWNDEAFRLLFFFDEIHEVDFSVEEVTDALNEFADYQPKAPLGFRRVREDVANALAEKYGSIWKWFQQKLLRIEGGTMELSKCVGELIEGIAAEGFVFHPWQIATFVTALRTKPFVILAGVSGTGKSKLPALVAKLTTGKIERVSVRPDWTDSADVLGYVDLQDQFRPGVVLQAAQAASKDGEHYHLCLLDEMNLARVEHYFAEVLSAIEDRHPSADGGYETTKLVAQALPAGFEQWQEQTIPANFGIVGTVNMDESSHGFSRKVLDRAFTLELSEVDLDLGQSRPSEDVEPAQWLPSFWHCRATRISECDPDDPKFRSAAKKATEALQRVNECLMHSQLQVGYRTRDEVILFLLNADELSDLFITRDRKTVDPLDLALMMKVLPRLVGGSNAIRRTMTGLLGLSHGQSMSEPDDAETLVENWVSAGRPDTVDGVTYPRTASRLCLMWERLTYEGYTSFWL